MNSKIEKYVENIISKFLYFNKMEEGLLKNFINICEFETFSTENIILHEGELAHHAYLIIKGTVEITKNSEKELVAVLHEGDWMGIPGEWMQNVIATTLPKEWSRSATVTTKTDVQVLKIHSSHFNHFINNHPIFEQEINRNREQVAFYNFIKSVTVFRHLSHNQINQLKNKVKKIKYPAGKILLQEGGTSEECYFIYSGKVEVNSKGKSSKTRILANLSKGDIFGEMSLLTDSPVNANVVTLEPCELFVLNDKDLELILHSDINATKNFSFLLFERSRPEKNHNVDVLEHLASDGSTTYVLRNNDTQNYFNLSKEGYFIWKNIDKNNTARELIELYIQQFKKLNLTYVEDLLTKLIHYGFIRYAQMNKKFARDNRTLWEKFTISLYRIMEAKYEFKNVNNWLNNFYSMIPKLLFNKLFQLFLILISLIGLYLFLRLSPQAVTQISRSDYSALFIIICLFFMRSLDLFVHEMGHALTTIHYKQPVKSMGIEWHWIQPFVFVDTSNMWACPPKERLIVDMAGIYGECIFIGILMVIGFLISNQILLSSIWLFALMTYLNIYFNLNPTLKLDGYYFLMDLLNAPNLRKRSALWIINVVQKVFKDYRVLLEYPPAIIYWSVCLLYIVFTIIFSSWISEKILVHIGLNSSLAMNIRWIFTFIMTILSFIGTVGEIKSQYKK